MRENVGAMETGQINSSSAVTPLNPRNTYSYNTVDMRNLRPASYICINNP